MITPGFLYWVLLSSPAAAPEEQSPVAALPAVSDADRARARALYEEGVGLFAARDWVAAMERFSAAYALDPSPVLLYNLARAAEENGEADGAVAHYRAYLEKFPDAEDRPEVERRIRILDAVLRNARRGSLALVEVPPGARVLINDKPAGETDEEGNWRRDPGTYALKVESDQGSYTTQIEVKAGEVTTVSWATPEEDGGELAIAGWSTAGTGALIVATGFLFWAEAHDAADTWNASVDRIAGGDTTPQALARKRQSEEDVATNGDTAMVLWTVGGLALATGAGMLIYEAVSEEPAPTASLVVLPQGIGVSGRF
jgi:tetratricopeptide (TPR) repeat protein